MGTTAQQQQWPETPPSGGKSICACGHSGDGPHSQHAVRMSEGHGPCTAKVVEFIRVGREKRTWAITCPEGLDGDALDVRLAKEAGKEFTSARPVVVMGKPGADGVQHGTVQVGSGRQVQGAITITPCRCKQFTWDRWSPAFRRQLNARRGR